MWTKKVTAEAEKQERAICTFIVGPLYHWERTDKSASAKEEGYDGAQVGVMQGRKESDSS